jgi:hypothetical protein
VPAGLAVRGDPAAQHVEGALRLLALVVQRRSELGWEVVDLVQQGLRQVDIASRLGITPQAVSSRLRVAAWPEEHAGRDLVTWLLLLTRQEAR